jgi:Ger(x)C family germination protein
MNESRILFVIFVILTLLTGCWDQKTLKHSKFMSTIGFDIIDDHKYLVTTAINLFKEMGEAKEQMSEIVMGEGYTVKDGFLSLDQMISDEPLPMKLNSILVSDDVARKDVYQVLDTFFRTPESPLGAKIIVVEGKASDVILLKKVGGTNIGDHLRDLMISAEDDSLIPKQTALFTFSSLFDPGKSIVLPFIKLAQGKIELGGLALFHQKQMTGKLSSKETQIFMLLADKIDQNMIFTEKINLQDHHHEGVYITIEVKDMNRKLSVKAKDPNDINVLIDVQLEAEIIEFPSDQLESNKLIEKINQVLTEKLTKNAEKVVNTLLDANCDAFGIGRELIAYHTEIWDQLDWEKAYPSIEIKPEIKVNIRKTGIIK